jgi:MraZ protein
MAFSILRGFFPLVIDEKNRLLVPAKLREQIKPQVDGESFILKIGPNGRLWFVCKKYDDAMAEALGTDAIPNDERQDYELLNYGMTDEVSWDKQGRMVVPQNFVDWAKLDKEVCLVAVKDHLELWNKTDWMKAMDDLRAKSGEIAAKLRLQKASGGGTAGGK